MIDRLEEMMAFVECDECEGSKDSRRWILDVGMEAGK